MTAPVVSLAKDSDIGHAVKKALARLNLPNLNGKRILLKPNVGRHITTEKAINTNPKVVQAVYETLQDQFDATFFLGDSPIISTNSKIAFEQSGYEELMNHPKITYLDLDGPPPLKCEIPKGQLLKRTKLTGYFNDFDYLISIPVLKMHMHTGASLSFKNFKGLLYKRTKIALHHLSAPDVIEPYRSSIPQIKELDLAIADLAHIIKPDLTIIDASYAQEGMGPSGGTPVKMDTIIASQNFLAADLVALHLVRPEWTLNNVPHLALISKFLPNMPKSLTDIRILPENYGDFQHPIQAPPSTVTISYPNVKLIDVDSCSSCLSTIFLFLKNNQEFIETHFTPENPLVLAIGKGITEDMFYEPTFFIGNCARKHKKPSYFVEGCAPVQSKLLALIKTHVETRDSSPN